MTLLEHDGLLGEVVNRLRAAGDDRTFDAAQMQLINLPEIIAGAGSEWPKLKDQIRNGSVSFLKGCLDDDDMVIPAGDGFLIIFAKGEAEALKARAAELRDMLLEFYMSQENIKRLGIKLDHHKISSQELRAMLAPAPAPSWEPTTQACMFAPVWSPSAQLIASYFCFPVHDDADGPRYGYDKAFAETGHAERRDYCALDIRLLDIVEEALQRYEEEDARPAIGVSVHATTMQHRTGRAAYLERLAKMPPRRVRQIYLKIAEVEPGAPIINLADWTGMLRSRVRNILLEFHHTETLPPNLSQVGVWGAGYQAPTSASREGVDAGPFVRQFARWGESMARQRLRLFIDNLRRPALIRVAAQAGVHFITSDNFWPLQKWPAGVVAAPMPYSPFPAAKKTLPSAAS